jgi:hypothetical protein
MARFLLIRRMRAHTTLAAAWLIAAAPLAAAQPYATAQLGWASTEWPLGAPLNGQIDDQALGLGVDFGVGFGRRWAFELGAYAYGGFDASGTPCAAGAACAPVVTTISGTEITILKAALAPRFEIGNARLFATFGYYRATLDTNLDLPDTRVHDSGALLGVGARWFFRDPWSVSLQATRFDDNLRQIMVGVGWGVAPRRGRTAD